MDNLRTITILGKVWPRAKELDMGYLGMSTIPHRRALGPGLLFGLASYFI